MESTERAIDCDAATQEIEFVTLLPSRRRLIFVSLCSNAALTWRPHIEPA
jgi:hypothetical protein